VTVVPAPANKLTILTQPPGAATAGAAFAPQPVIRIEDQFGNLIASDSSRTVTATRSAGSGTLQGTTVLTTLNGLAVFTNLSYNVAETITINFTASGLTGATSGNVLVSPTTVTQLAFSTQPAGISRTGSRLAIQPVVKSQDTFGNNSTVGLPASLNVGLALTAGSGSLLGTTVLDIGAGAGNGTMTFTNVECSDAGTNKQLTASTLNSTSFQPLPITSATFLVGGVERATGGSAIPSSSAGGTYTALTGPTYYEAATADVGIGTIILNAPSGFIFDKGGTAPTVLVMRLTGSGSNGNNINGVASGTSVAITSATSTQITLTVKSSSTTAVTCSLTWQNLRVRPTASSPLASGNITKTSTSTLAAVTNSVTSFGSLVELGPLVRLAIRTQPSPTATGGTVTNQVIVNVSTAAPNAFGASPAHLLGINALTNGMEITFAGSPGYTYHVQRTAALQGSNTLWRALGLAVANDAGQGQFTDTNPPQERACYRLVWP